MKRWPELPRSLRVRKNILICDARTNRSLVLDSVAPGGTMIAYPDHGGHSEPVVAFYVNDHCSDPLCTGTAITRVHDSHFDINLFYRDGSGPPRMYDTLLKEIPVAPDRHRAFSSDGRISKAIVCDKCHEVLREEYCVDLFQIDLPPMDGAAIGKSYPWGMITRSSADLGTGKKRDVDEKKLHRWREGLEIDDDGRIDPEQILLQAVWRAASLRSLLVRSTEGVFITMPSYENKRIYRFYENLDLQGGHDYVRNMVLDDFQADPDVMKQIASLLTYSPIRYTWAV